MSRPLVVLAIAFCLGIAVAYLIKFSFALICILILIFLIFAFSLRKKEVIFKVVLLITAFLLGALSLKNTFILPANHISNYIFKSDSPYLVKGVINSEPQFKDKRLTFILRVEEIHIAKANRKCSGNIIVYIRSRAPLFYGQELLLYGNIYRPFSKNTPGRTNYRSYLYNRGIFFKMNVKNNSCIIRLKKNRGLFVKRLALWLKNKMEDAIFKHTSPTTASVLDAMILGEKKNIPWFISQGMMKSGTIHILVVSGFNVGIVAFIINLFLRLIRLPRKVRFYIAIPCLLIYCLMTGASTPVIRATVMAIFFIAGFLLRRESDIYNSLCIAAIFILAFNPRQLFDIGFQLSFASVVSIVYLYPKMKSFLRIDLLKNKFIKLPVDSCLVSLAAWIGTFGLVAFYFKIFSPVTVLANIIIVPLATLMTLCGFSLIMMPPLAQFLAPACEIAVLLLLKANAFLIQLPAAYFYLS